MKIRVMDLWLFPVRIWLIRWRFNMQLLNLVEEKLSLKSLFQLIQVTYFVGLSVPIVNVLAISLTQIIFDDSDNFLSTIS